MISNRVKKNIWGTLLVLGIFTVAARIIDVATGGKWWQLVSAIAITAIPLKAYVAYRKAVKDGNLAGKVSPFQKQRPRRSLPEE